MQKWRKLIPETVSQNKVKEKVGENWLRGAPFLLHISARLYLFIYLGSDKLIVLHNT